MPFDRVIQDSDDEDDPLPELSPEKKNRVAVTNHVMQHGAESLEAHEVGHDAHIGVNFDDYLQSQDAPQTIMSSSQQRREERWIPGATRVVSMGTMMTEIGLAQQRLLDDVHQAEYADQSTVFHEPAPIPTLDNHEMLAREEGPLADNLLSTPEQVHGAGPGDEWSQSAPSYNIFDSSLHTPSGQLNQADFISDSGITIQTEPMQNLEARRWASMQGAHWSPHDTEPFSSVISPKVTRAKSGNMMSSILQQSPASIDELALPLTTELPKIEKRGRKKKKKQTPPMDVEDDELSHAQSREPPPNKPEKRRPGRPPKNVKVSLDDCVNARPVESPEIPGPAADETQGATGSTAVENNNPLPQAPIEDPVVAPEQRVLSPALKSAKEPEKKLKYGKTTSVTLTKMNESEVEDDVIWVDERPVIPPAQEDQIAPKPAKPSNDATLEPAPAPKKRGRKRKKTSEQLDQESTVPPATDEPQRQNITLQEENNPRQLYDSHHVPGISVVLKKTTSTSTRTHNPDTTIPNTEETSTPDPPQDLPQPTSPTSLSELSETAQPPETPQKPTDPKTPSTKGPGKHSPISSTCKVPYRVGLSKKARIAPLLKIIKR